MCAAARVSFLLTGYYILLHVEASQAGLPHDSFAIEIELTKREKIFCFLLRHARHVARTSTSTLSLEL